MDDADPFIWTDVCNMPMADEHVERASVQPSHDAPQLPPVGIAAELRRSPHVLVADQSYVSQVPSIYHVSYEEEDTCMFPRYHQYT
jgi:hypothetical protein